MTGKRELSCSGLQSRLELPLSSFCALSHLTAAPGSCRLKKKGRLRAVWTSKTRKLNPPSSQNSQCWLAWDGPEALVSSLRKAVTWTCQWLSQCLRLDPSSFCSCCFYLNSIHTGPPRWEDRAKPEVSGPFRRQVLRGCSTAESGHLGTTRQGQEDFPERVLLRQI